MQKIFIPQRSPESVFYFRIKLSKISGADRLPDLSDVRVFSFISVVYILEIFMIWILVIISTLHGFLGLLQTFRRRVRDVWSDLPPRWCILTPNIYIVNISPIHEARHVNNSVIYKLHERPFSNPKEKQNTVVVFSRLSSWLHEFTNLTEYQWRRHRVS